ncbi:MAG: hypothetical protein ACQESC_00690 [Nanobdellota archaeon]
MARDIVIAQPGEETAFIETAKRLGFDELLLLYEETSGRQAQHVTDSALTIKKGVILHSTRVSPWMKSFDEIALLGTRNTTIPKGITLLINNEFEPEKDFMHQRRSGLNHVVLSTCHEKGISVIVGVTDVFKNDMNRQAVLLGRIRQNNVLARRKNVFYSVVSLARSPEKMRSSHDMKAFNRVLEQK